MVIYSWHETADTPAHFLCDSKEKDLQNVWPRTNLTVATEVNHAVTPRKDSCCDVRIEITQSGSTDDMEKCLPALERNHLSPNWKSKRTQHNRYRSSTGEPALQLPGIKVLRKNSVPDSTITNSNSTSTTSSSLAWDTSDSESILPFNDDGNSADIRNSIFSQISSMERIQCVPHPPESPRPTALVGRNNNGTHTFQKRRRSFNRSQHFELTLQNIEEVIDLEKSTSRPSSLKYGKQSGSVAGLRPKGKRPEAIHRRSYSTPIDYRELKLRIEQQSKLVNMGEMSPEFTRNVLANNEEEDESTKQVREKCVSWLQSLNTS